MARLHFTSRKVATATAFCVAALGSACTTTESERDGKLETLLQPTLLAAARTAEARYDYASAALNYRNLHQRNPGDLRLTLDLARTLRYSGEIEAAIQLLTPAAEQADAPARLLLELGKAHLAADHINLAKRYLQRAAAGSPDDWQIYSALAVAYDYKNDYAQAAGHYRKALELAPDNPIVLNNFGLSLAQAGDLDAAATTLRAAVDQPNASAQMRQNLALILALQGDTEAAERLARMDLPPELLRQNMHYYRRLSGEGER